MYAVVSTGGKQYRVEAGSELIVERLTVDPGASVTFDRILLVGDGEAVTIGTPTVDGATVSGTVIGEARGPKLIIFKYKQKVKYRRTTGHRQHLTRVRIDEISADGRRETAPKAEEAPAKAEVEVPQDASTLAEAEVPTAPARARRVAKPKAQAGEAAKDTAESKAEPEAPEAKPARRRRTPTKKAGTEA